MKYNGRPKNDDVKMKKCDKIGKMGEKLEKWVKTIGFELQSELTQFFYNTSRPGNLGYLKSRVMLTYFRSVFGSDRLFLTGLHGAIQR